MPDDPQNAEAGSDASLELGRDAMRIAAACLGLDGEKRHDHAIAECGGDRRLLDRVERLLATSLASDEPAVAMGEEPTHDSGTIAHEAPTSAGELPDVGEKSVILSRDPSGRLGPGVKLQDLDSEPALPALHTGSERYDVLKLLGRGGIRGARCGQAAWSSSLDRRPYVSADDGRREVGAAGSGS